MEGSFRVYFLGDFLFIAFVDSEIGAETEGAAAFGWYWKLMERSGRRLMEVMMG